MRSQPLTLPVLLLIAGILAGRYFPVPLLWVLGMAFLMLIPLFWKRSRIPALSAAVFLIGWLVFAMHFEITSPADLRVLVGEQPAVARVRGVIIDPPLTRTYIENGRPKESSNARVRLNAVEIKGVWHEVLGDVMVSTPAVLPDEFFPGQKVVVDGVLKLPPKALAEGLFDYRYYLEIQRIFYQFTTESGKDWQLVGTPGARPPLTLRFQRWAEQRLVGGLPQQNDTAQLLSAMTLGTRTSGNPELSQPFMRTGTLHIFAISGLHVACIAGLLVGMGKALGLPRHGCAWLVVPLIWFYTAATGWQSSAIRSAIMSSVVIVGWGLKRPANLLNSLAAAALIILLWQPEQLFQASFQLSFAVVLSIGLFMPLLEESRKKLFASDPLLPPELRPGWQKWAEKGLEFLAGNTVISIAAFLGALPVVAYYFNLVTPNSLIANLVAVPLSSLSLAFSLVALICPPVFNFLSWAMMDDVARFTAWLAQWPLGYFYVPKPGLAFFLFYYAVLVFAMTDTFRNGRLKYAALSVIVISALGLSISSYGAVRETTITMLPIRGAPVVIDQPGHENDLLIDCSSKREAEHVLARYLHAQGFGNLPRVALTHGEIGHVEGFEILDREFSPREVVASGLRFRSGAYRKIIDDLHKRSPQRLKEVARGQTLARWKVLHPDPGEKAARADDKCLVLLGTIEGTRVLILSDLGHLGQRALVRAFPDLRADVVLAGMPGAEEPLEEELLGQLRPKVIVLGTSGYPGHEKGSRGLRERLYRSGAKVFFTGDNGAVTLRFLNGTCTIRYMEKEEKL